MMMAVAAAAAALVSAAAMAVANASSGFYCSYPAVATATDSAKIHLFAKNLMTEAAPGLPPFIPEWANAQICRE